MQKTNLRVAFILPFDPEALCSAKSERTVRLQLCTESSPQCPVFSCLYPSQTKVFRQEVRSSRNSVQFALWSPLLLWTSWEASEIPNMTHKCYAYLYSEWELRPIRYKQFTPLLHSSSPLSFCFTTALVLDSPHSPIILHAVIPHR